MAVWIGSGTEMSRSHRHTPICGNGIPRAGNESWWKRWGNKRWRRAVKDALACGQYDALPRQREVADVWCYPKDGKQWFGDEPSRKREWRK